jgi:hypothetical protein
MMCGDEQDVTIRRLPCGVAVRAWMTSCDRDRLVLLPAPEGESLEAGALVEVVSPQTLYLGVVTDHSGASRIVSVEHFADLTALAEIGKMWKTAVR